MQSGVLLVKNGNYWMSNGSYVDKTLTVRTNLNIVPIGTLSKLNGNCNSGVNRKSTGEYFSLSNCSYNATTKLYYTSYRNAYSGWTQAKNDCASIGMRLPLLSETSNGISGGIPSSSWSRSATPYYNPTNGVSHYAWNGTSKWWDSRWDDGHIYHICVIEE